MTVLTPKGPRTGMVRVQWSAFVPRHTSFYAGHSGYDGCSLSTEVTVVFN